MVESQEVITDAIIFTKRTQITTAFREELKKNGLGPEDYHYPSTPSETKEIMESSLRPILILDWDQGQNKIVLILEAIQQEHRQDLAPVFLIADDHSDDVQAAATEYGVRKIHLGNVTQTTISAGLNEIFDEQRTLTPVRTLLIQVCELKRQNENDRALDILVKLFRTHSDNERVIVELADTYLTLDKPDEALGVLMPLIESNPNDARLLNIAGRAYLKQGDYPAASSHLQRAKILNPINPSRLIALGQALLNMGRLDPAEASFLEASNMTDPHNKAAQMGIGECKLLKGDINDALKLLNQVSTPREMASVFNSAAIVAMRLGNPDQGMQLYDSAISTIGKDHEIASKLFYNKGIGFTKSKKVEAALGAFQKAVELDPANANAKFNIAVLKGDRQPSFSGNTARKTQPAADELIDDFDDSFAFEIEDEKLF